MKRLVKFQSVLPLILLLALGLIIGSSPGLAASTYTGGDNGKTITVGNGEMFMVKLEENPTTGYSWNLTVGNGLQIVSDRYVPNMTSASIVGSGGYHEWTIRAVSNGTFKVSGIYKRPWEQTTGSEQKYALTVKVTGSQAQGMGSKFPSFSSLSDFKLKLDAIKFKPGNMSALYSFGSIFDHFPKLSVFGS